MAKGFTRNRKARSSQWAKPLRGVGNMFRWIRNAFRAGNLDILPWRFFLRGYTREAARSDLRAGFNVALVGFPQAIAFALIAGLHPQHGLLSVGIGAAVGAAFSGSRLVVMGPGNSTAILIFSGMAASGLPEEQRIFALPLFIFMVGCFQIIGALANLSLILNYVSRSVVTAYITAAAALIVVNQSQNLLGFSVEESSTFFTILGGTLSNLDQARLPEVMIGIVSLGCILAIRRLAPRIPDAALTLILMGFGALYMEWMGWDLRYLRGFSADAIDYLSMPFDVALLGTWAAPAVAVAFLGVVEGTSVGRSLASRSGEHINVNQVMFGMGIANLSNSLVGAMDASGSITRSALNWSSGARTPLSVVISGGIGLILLFTLGWLIAYIPMAALAAVVLAVAFSLFDRHQISVALKATPTDAAVFTITLASGLLFTLDMAIYIGVFTSIILFLRKASVPELVEYTFTSEGQLAAAGEETRPNAPGISILHAEGDLFFGSTELFVEQARQATLDPSLKVVILRLKNARHLDATSALAIDELRNLLKTRDRHLLISGAHKEVYRVFRNTGLLDRLGRENFFMEKPSNPALSTRDALRRAQELLGEQEADIRIFVDKRKQKTSADAGEGANDERDAGENDESPAS